MWAQFKSILVSFYVEIPAKFNGLFYNSSAVCLSEIIPAPDIVDWVLWPLWDEFGKKYLTKLERSLRIKILAGYTDGSYGMVSILL